MSASETRDRCLETRAAQSESPYPSRPIDAWPRRRREVEGSLAAPALSFATRRSESEPCPRELGTRPFPGHRGARRRTPPRRLVWPRQRLAEPAALHGLDGPGSSELDSAFSAALSLVKPEGPARDGIRSRQIRGATQAAAGRCKSLSDAARACPGMPTRAGPARARAASLSARPFRHAKGRRPGEPPRPARSVCSSQTDSESPGTRHSEPPTPSPSAPDQALGP